MTNPINTSKFLWYIWPIKDAGRIVKKRWEIVENINPLLMAKEKSQQNI